MAEKQLNPILKMALELGPILIFFFAYRMADVAPDVPETEAQLQKMLFATMVFIPAILIALAISWILTRHLPKMAVVTAVLVVVFGGLTLWLRDDTFIKMKPTILYLLFGATLGFGLLRGESYLKYLMDGVMPLQEAGWMKFTTRFAIFFFCLAIVNEIVWRSMSTDAWVNFKTFFLPAASFAFVLSQIGLFNRYAIDDDDAAE